MQTAGRVRHEWGLGRVDEECRSPVFGEAIQEAMARKGCDLTLEESQHFARTLLDLIDKGMIVADSSVKPGAEIPGDSCPPREIGHNG